MLAVTSSVTQCAEKSVRMLDHGSMTDGEGRAV